MRSRELGGAETSAEGRVEAGEDGSNEAEDGSRAGQEEQYADPDVV